MTIRLHSLLNADVQPRLLEVEIFSQFQIPHFVLIGLPGPEIQESKERVRAAIENAGFAFPNRKIVLNLTPPGVRKSGTGLDLALACAVLLYGHGTRKPPKTERRFTFWGELSLTGEVQPTGCPTRALMASQGTEALFFPASEKNSYAKTYALLKEAGVHPAVPVPVDHLKDCFSKLEAFLKHGESAASEFRTAFESQSLSTALERTQSDETPALLDEALQDVLGIALSGHHHLLLLGAKGTGKTTALSWVDRLLPPASAALLIERLCLAEISGHDQVDRRIRRISTLARPAALIGSAQGTMFRPGEFSLAHGGVLLADEFLEWSRDARESLRDPLERGRVSLTRTQRQIDAPARFLFMGSANLCACGERKSAEDTCRCKADERDRYWRRLSGPIRDRIDLVWVQTLSRARGSPRFADSLRARIAATRERLMRAHGVLPGLASAEQSEVWAQSLGIQPADCQSLRERHKLARTSVTLAAWEGSGAPTARHLLRAKLYRIDRVM